MRPAPPLAVRCSSSVAWRLACATVGALAGVSLAAWVAGHLDGAPFRQVALLVAAVAGVALGVLAAGSSAQVHVEWDGQRWVVDGVVGRPQVMLDLDRWLLLLRHRPLAPCSRARWVALSFVRRSEEHRALRAALYSSQPEANLEPPHVRAPDRAAD